MSPIDDYSSAFRPARATLSTPVDHVEPPVEPAEESKPADDLDAKPAEESKLAEEPKPSEDSGAKPAEEPKPAEEVKPEEETKPVEEVKPEEETAPVDPHLLPFNSDRESMPPPPPKRLRLPL